MLLLTVVLVMAAMMVASAMPAFAQGGPPVHALLNQPRNYGDCVSAIGSGLSPVLPVGGDTVQEFTDNTAPLQSRGQGNPDEFGTDCRYFQPGLP
jgi:hypothetical protein